MASAGASCESTEDREFARASEPSRLPPVLRVLCVSATEPSWVNLTLQLDAEGGIEPRLTWVSTSGEAVAVLRDERFDCIVVAAEPHEGPLALLDAIRAGGCETPTVLLASSLTDAQWKETCRHDCEVLASGKAWDSAALVPVIRQAIARRELTHENRRLSAAQHRRLVRERDETEHLLEHQRRIVQELEALAEDRWDAPPTARSAPDVALSSSPLPPEVDDYYHELLRAYVIMGSGNLAGEIARLAELIAEAGLSPREALRLHVDRVEALVRGLGNRSARHVMSRADLLALEVMIHLGECYRRR